MISKQKIEALEKRLEELHIGEKDLLIKFILGSGPGGQKINKTASTVYLKHLPSGIEVKCGKERSRELNRYRALQLLCEKMEKILYDEKSSKEKEEAKKRKQKQRRSRRAQKKVLEEKRQHSEKKFLRNDPQEE